MSRILLIGGSGILGSEVLRQLQVGDFDYAAPRSSDLDFRKKGNLENYISNLKPNWIINCAGWTNVEEAEDSFEAARELNEVAVKTLAQSANKFGCLLIHISTDYVFDGSSSEPYDEEAPVNPVNKYGESKLLGEQAILEVIPTTSFIIRTSWLYSAKGKNFVKTMAKKALHDEISRVVDDQVGSPTSAQDLARGITSLIAHQPAPGIYHYSNTGSCTWYELACSIYTKVGAPSTLVEPIPSTSLNLKAKRPKFSLLSKEKWKSSGLSEIPNWESSLDIILPEILTEIRESEKL